MSSAANMSAPRAATDPKVPQLSKRALDGLKKGASVQLWVERKPFVFQGKEEKQEFLCSTATALLRHFSNRWKRELAATDTKRVSVPFFREQMKLVHGWMMAGGGNKLGTPDVAYPKSDSSKLKILKDLATHLEIDSLAELIEKDIAAVIPALPPAPVPAAGSAPAPSTKRAPNADKNCFFCGKKGHIQYGCRERNALFVNESQGPTYSLKGKGPPAQTSSMYSQAPTVHDRALRYVEAGSNQPKSAEPAANKTSPTRQKLIPYSGHIMARDAEGWQYRLDWRQIQMAIDWPVTGDRCEFSGTAKLDSW